MAVLETILEPDVPPVTVIVVDEDLPTAVEAFAADPAIQGFRLAAGLDLSPLDAVDPDEVRALVFDGALNADVTTRFEGLEVLHAASLTRSDLERLGDRLDTLQVLRATESGDLGGDMQVLADAPAYAELHVLHLVDPCVGDDGLRGYFDGPRPFHLRELVLENESARGCVRGMQGMGVYTLGRGNMPNLQTLGLARQRLDSLYSLTKRDSTSTKVTKLDLRETSCAGSVGYLGRSNMPLEELDLHGLCIADYARKDLFRGDLPKTLRSLRMSTLGNGGLQQLAEEPLKLTTLRLDCAELTSLDALVAAKWFQKVHTLDLAWNFLDDEALAPLRSESLQRVRLTGNPVSTAAVEALIERSPALTDLVLER